MGRPTKTQQQTKIRAEKAQENIVAEINRMMTKHAPKLVQCSHFRIDVNLRDDGTAGVVLNYSTIVSESGNVTLDDQSDLTLGNEPPE